MVQVQPQVFKTVHFVNIQTYMRQILHPKFHFSNARNFHDRSVVSFYPNSEPKAIQRLGIFTLSFAVLVVCLRNLSPLRTLIRVFPSNGVGNAGVRVKFNRGRASLTVETPRNTTTFVALSF
jgi:hypothetical protein